MYTNTKTVFVATLCYSVDKDLQLPGEKTYIGKYFALTYINVFCCNILFGLCVLSLRYTLVIQALLCCRSIVYI